MSVNFARAGLRSSSATKVLEVTKPVLLLFISLWLWLQGSHSRQEQSSFPQTQAEVLHTSATSASSCSEVSCKERTALARTSHVHNWAQTPLDPTAGHKSCWIQRLVGRIPKNSLRPHHLTRFGCFHLLLST